MLLLADVKALEGGPKGDGQIQLLKRLMKSAQNGGGAV